MGARALRAAARPRAGSRPTRPPSRRPSPRRRPSANSTYGGGAGAGVSQREASMAGRQFTAGTEKGYRAGRQDLAAGYAAVDRMEAATAALDGYDSIAFIMEGDLGRRGVDYGLPARLPPTPEPAAAPELAPGRCGGGDPGGLFGKLGGKIGRELGGSTGEKIGGRAAAKVANAPGKGYVESIGKNLTPDQEYYLGRAVAATAIAKYGVEPDENLRRYVRRIGDAVVRCQLGRAGELRRLPLRGARERRGERRLGPRRLRADHARRRARLPHRGRARRRPRARARARAPAPRRAGPPEEPSVPGPGRGDRRASSARSSTTDKLGFEGKLVELFTTAVSEVATPGRRPQLRSVHESQADQDGTPHPVGGHVRLDRAAHAARAAWRRTPTSTAARPTSRRRSAPSASTGCCPRSARTPRARARPRRASRASSRASAPRRADRVGRGGRAVPSPAPPPSSRPSMPSAASAPRSVETSRLKRALIGIAIGVVVTVLLALGAQTTVGEALDLRTTDLRTRRLAGERAPDPRIVLCQIVDDDLQRRAGRRARGRGTSRVVNAPIFDLMKRGRREGGASSTCSSSIGGPGPDDLRAGQGSPAGRAGRKRPSRRPRPRTWRSSWNE